MEKEKGLKSTTIGLMIGTAIFYDITQWLLAFIFMDWLVGFFAFMTFYVWFKMHGISFMKPKRFATMSMAGLIEVIPFLSAIPAWTLAVTILALDAKIKASLSSGKGDPTKAINIVNKLKESGGKMKPSDLNK
jgi:hypothetical protein